MSGTMSTKLIGVNAKGQNRRLGKSKKSSAIDGDEHVQSTKRSRVSSAAASEGLRSKIKRYAKESNIMVSHNEYNDFLQYSAPPRVFQDQEYKTMFSRWLWLTQVGGNILLYGPGDKKKILLKFVKDNLSGEDVLEMDGLANPSVLSLLRVIATSVLSNTGDVSYLQDMSLTTYVDIITEKLVMHYGTARDTTEFSKIMGDKYVANSSSSCSSSFAIDDDMFATRKSSRSSASLYSNFNYPHPGSSLSSKWPGRFSTAKSKLYIVIHDIGASSLSSLESQLCLAKLAQCSSVCIIATMCHLNTPLMWGSGLLSRFQWNMELVATFLPSPVSASFPCVMREADYAASTSSNDSATALEFLLTSLSQRHHELLLIICKYILEVSAARDGQNTGSAAGSAFVHKKGSVAAKADSADDTPTHLLKSMPINALLERCKAGMVAQTQVDVKVLLKEYEDHKIVSIVEWQRTENVVLHVPFERIQLLAVSLNSSKT